MNPEVFRQNRAAFGPAELNTHQGRWVAFSSDGRRIIASSKDLELLDKMITDAGEDPEQVALERIEPDDVSLGAAEFS